MTEFNIIHIACPVRIPQYGESGGIAGFTAHAAALTPFELYCRMGEHITNHMSNLTSLVSAV